MPRSVKAGTHCNVTSAITPSAPSPTRADDRPRQRLDRRRVGDRRGRAALVARPVAPLGPGCVRIARLAHQMTEPEPTASPAARAPRARSLPTPGARRATVIGAGSFGTALAVLLARSGLRTTLQ